MDFIAPDAGILWKYPGEMIVVLTWLKQLSSAINATSSETW